MPRSTDIEVDLNPPGYTERLADAAERIAQALETLAQRLPPLLGTETLSERFARANPTPSTDGPLRVGDIVRDKEDPRSTDPARIIAIRDNEVRVHWLKGDIEGITWWPLADFERIESASAP